MRKTAVVLLHQKRWLNIGPEKVVELGEIVDIGWGGMLVQCRGEKPPAKKTLTLSVKVPPDNFVLNRIPFQTVGDCASSDDGDCWHRRIKFGILSSDQKDELTDFIYEYTVQS